VTKVHAEARRYVRAGDALWEQDNRGLAAQVPVRESEFASAHATVKVGEAALGNAQVQLTMIEKVADRRAIREEDLERRRIAVSAAKAQLNVDRAVLTHGQAALAPLRSDLSRLKVVAPIDGEILKEDVHPGEYAVVPSPSPLIVMGDTSTMHLRADVAEEDAPHFIPGRTAYASPRGAGGQRIPLTFVRVEPRILPKGNFTADTVERIDTRVLQVIYRVSGDARVYDGELMDVYIDAPERIPVTEKGKAFLAASVRGAQDRTVHIGEAVESAERA
jgi:HlyD family secretion protein